MTAMIWTSLPICDVRTTRALDRACELLMADWIAVGNPATLDMVDLLRRLQVAIDDCYYEDGSEDSMT